MGRCRNIIVFITAYLALVIHVGLFMSISAWFVDIMDTYKIPRARAAVVQSIATGLYGTCGIGISMIYISSCTILGQYWQDKNVVLVLSVHATGSGGIGYPYLLQYLSKHYGLRGAFLISGGILFQGLVFALCWKPTNNRSISNKLNETTIIDDVKPLDAIKNITDHVRKERYTTNTDTNTITTKFNSDNKAKQIRKTTHNSSKDTTQTSKTDSTLNETQPRTTLSTFRKIITVLKMKSFIPFIAAQALGFTSTLIYLFFIVDIITDIGYSEDKASIALMSFNIAGTVGRLLPGLLLRGTPLPVLFVPAISCAIGIIGFVTLIFGETFAIIIVASSVIGFSSGIIVTAFTVVSLRLVDEMEDCLSIALGVALTVSGTLNAVAGPLNGLIRDVTGTYSIVLWEAVGCFALAIMILGCAQLSRYRHNTSFNQK